MIPVTEAASGNSVMMNILWREIKRHQIPAAVTQTISS